jgi:hypothetical protein
VPLWEVRKVKIKKIDRKPMTIHRKQETKLRKKRNIRIDRSTQRGIKLSSGPIIERILHPRDFVSNYNARVFNKGLSHKVREDTRNLNKRKRSNRNQISKDNGNFERPKHSTKHRSGGIRTLGIIEAKIVTDQLEGGEEVHDSAVLASMGVKPIVGTVAKSRNMYHGKSQRQQFQKKFKRINVGNRVGKKTVKNTSKKAIKASTKKVVKESAKAGASATSAVAGTAAGTATTGPGGILIGMAAGKAAGYKMDRIDLKNSTRSRMLNYFLNKTKQHQNQDSVGSLVKDLIMMRVSMTAKHIITYIGGLLLMLVMVIAIVCIPIILIIAVAYNSPFAIFFPPLEDGDTVMSVTSAYVQEFNREVSTLANDHAGYDEGTITYIGTGGNTSSDNYYDIIAVYMVKHGIGDTASVMNDTTKSRLKAVFDDMCGYTTSSVTETIENEDGTTTSHAILYVNVTLRSYREMISIYGFNEDEVELLDEMMSQENLAILQ